MLDPVINERFLKLLDSRIQERRKLFPIDIKKIDYEANAKGMYHSSTRILQIRKAYEHELDVRAILAWQSLHRVHQTFGAQIEDELRADFKFAINHLISNIFDELSISLASNFQSIPANIDLSLTEARVATTFKHEIEIDLYIDSISNSNLHLKPMTQNYNFYGNIGAVQTGASATANIVQNLSDSDKNALQESLAQVISALENAASIASQQKNDLIEITQDCITTLNSSNPNNTKLLTMFNVLGTAIQSISSAQPAYQALKIAVLPLGINLP
jgi:hypothetical protein